MKTIQELLRENPGVSDYRISTGTKESYEMFFVRGKLETVRCTDTCDRQVTVYVNHDGEKGDSVFYVYPSTTEAELRQKIEEAVQNALLIHNADYALPEAAEGEYRIPSNLGDKPLPELAEEIAGAVFRANTLEGGSLNSVEVFLNKYCDTVENSRGLHKTQHRCSAMVEAIPTFNGDRQSVELYEQYNFGSYDPQTLIREIAGKMEEVKARYEAETPDFAMDCPVVLGRLELAELFSSVAGDLNYSAVYSHSNLFKKGDRIQEEVKGDPITITMKGEAEGNIRSACFDADGMELGQITIVREGVAENYYGSNRFGQYLGETPTGNLGCLCVSPGTAKREDLQGGSWLEVISMSGLQVDFFNDYIGGEIRLAYYHDGEKTLPVTGISISGKLRQVLSTIRLSAEEATHNGYMGPAKAILTELKIF